jgi:hypothetical protein
MTQNEVNGIVARVAWLERKMRSDALAYDYNDLCVLWLRGRVQHRQVLWMAVVSCGDRSLADARFHFAAARI